MNALHNSIFNINNEQEFEKLSLEVFRLQYEKNVVYQNYVKQLKKDVGAINRLEDIPFLPISFFKTHTVVSAKIDAQKTLCFESSGTTSSNSSKHYVVDPSIYELSFQTNFEQQYGAIKDYCVLGLLPSYLERKNSSLIYMVNEMIRTSAYEESGFFLDQLDDLNTLLNKCIKQKIPTLLIGVSFALIDFSERFTFPTNDNLIVMETGGMKGRRKELIRAELHHKLQKRFGLRQIHSEYGMTELLSQAYAKVNGIFECPPWMKVMIRQQEDPFSYQNLGKTGAINVIDLANINSCSFIQTDDLGRGVADNAFEVLGRHDQAEVRGCNLMIT